MTTGVCNTLNTGAGVFGQVLASAGSGHPAAGTNSATQGGAVLLGTVTATNQASAIFTSLIGATYSSYRVIGNNILSFSTTVPLYFQISSNNGSSYENTSEYFYHQLEVQLATSPNTQQSGTNTSTHAAFIKIVQFMSTVTPMSIIIDVINPSATYNAITYFGQYYDSNNSVQRMFGGSGSAPGQTYNAFRLMASSGNITGTFKVYGFVAS